MQKALTKLEEEQKKMQEALTKLEKDPINIQTAISGLQNINIYDRPTVDELSEQLYTIYYI